MSLVWTSLLPGHSCTLPREGLQAFQAGGAVSRFRSLPSLHSRSFHHDSVCTAGYKTKHPVTAINQHPLIPLHALRASERSMSVSANDGVLNGKHPDPRELPSGRFIRVVEVSARDGLQNLPTPAVPTEVKRELVSRLLDAGVRNIEVGSFVRSDWVPQMADTEQLLRILPPLSGSVKPLDSVPLPPTSNEPSSDPAIEAMTVHYPVLVPNMRGMDNLLKLEESWRNTGAKNSLTDEIAVFVSATEAFSQANNHASVEKVLAGLPAVIDKAGLHGYRVRGYVSCVITCPYSGPTPPEQVVDVAKRLLDMGCYEVSLGDTTGEGNPHAWATLWSALETADLPMPAMAAHCHDTFSMALSSLISLLPRGLATVDASLAGLGGCPYSPGATGNVPTEDVVYALHKLGYRTGIDLDRLVEAGNWLSETLRVRNESRVGRAIWARRVAKQSSTASPGLSQ
ncbi:hypothetical protein BCR39DRAFT_524508 [Naematelia encephala]|uniref:hydroxymethylglutaryl-CoA lyase n=1 Tax=Naematelia encephala TaxID=71784 RepID=A0A1Y2BBH2_9TREE|nr:hypothetical protein BCR39DRAFT_524508 [Naematelia encephala]